MDSGTDLWISAQIHGFVSQNTVECTKIHSCEPLGLYLVTGPVLVDFAIFFGAVGDGNGNYDKEQDEQLHLDSEMIHINTS